MVSGNQVHIKVKTTYTLYNIANTVLGGFVNSNQLKDANNILDLDLIDIG